MESCDTANDGRVIPKTTVAVKLDEILEDVFDIILTRGALGLTRNRLFRWVMKN